MNLPGQYETRSRTSSNFLSVALLQLTEQNNEFNVDEYEYTLPMKNHWQIVFNMVGCLEFTEFINILLSQSTRGKTSASNNTSTRLGTLNVGSAKFKWGILSLHLNL